MKLLIGLMLFVLSSAFGQVGLPFPGPGGASTASAQPPQTNLKLWIEADCITISPCAAPANGTNITSWADQSSNANNLTKSSGTCTLNTSQINSLPAVTFSSCHLDFTNIVAANEAVIFLVMKNSTTSGGPYSIFSGHSNAFGYRTVVSGKEQDMLKVQVADGLHSTSSADTSWHQLNGFSCNGSCPGSLQAFRIDRTADGSSGGTSGQSAASSGIGYNVENGGEAFNGQLAALLYYTGNNNSIATTVDITAVETYLFNKYGL